MDPWISDHTKWLTDSGKRLKTKDGKEVEVWDFQHLADQDILTKWAGHFRNHYCLDTHIDTYRTKKTRKDYLNNFKFPSTATRLGPSVRAGDFGEILVADYLEWRLGFWVPRVRWCSKIIRDESAKGCDVIGFKKAPSGKASQDTLIIFESKTKFSASGDSRLQDAVNDSSKDAIRRAESLNFIVQKLHEESKTAKAELVDRFQNPVDMPYEEIFGAAAIISNEHYDEAHITAVDCRKIPKSSRSKVLIPHPHVDKLVLLVIKGKDMMALANELYRRAADEA